MDALSLDFFLVLYLLTLLLVPVVITKKKKPVVAVAWLMAIVFIPILGTLLFMIFGTERIQNKGRKKLFSNETMRNHLRELETSWAPKNVLPHGSSLPREHENIVRLCRKMSSFDAVSHNSVEILVDAEEIYAKMEEAIQAAQHHINLESYIFEPDEIGGHFRDLLIAKAKQGVRVNLLYDAVGSMNLGWDHTFLNSFRDAGITPRAFLPLRTFFKPWNANLRNHRKILIVDNQVGFTGSLNIGKQFWNGEKSWEQKWRETHVIIKGPGVTQLQWIFCEDWYFATDEELLEPEYFLPAKEGGGEVVQVVASGPDVREEAIYKAYLMAITLAQKSIYLSTPYFIPDQTLYLALQLAALRNVDVRLLVPHHADHLFVWFAGRSYYEELLENGVRIYEFLPAYLHVKKLIVDNSFTALGSANIDLRSFSYNFEVNLQIYGERVAGAAEAIFFDDLKNSRELKLDRFLHRPAHMRFRENFCRLFSPLL